MIKFNKWTLGLAAVGAVTLPSVVKADENPSPVLTALSSTVISGYVDTSAQWNLGTGNANNPAYGYGGNNATGAVTKNDGFNLNAVELTIERDPDAKDGWGAGYMVQMVFGPDANSLATSSAPSGGNYSDFAIRQAYVDLKAPVGNGLDIKVGVWNTLLGYEVFESGNNPNFTRSYGYTMEPTTHTGVLLSYQFADWLGVSAGVANTFGPAINARANFPGTTPTRAESYKAYTGSVSLTAPKDWGFIAGSTLYGAVINGFNSGSASGPGNPATQTSYYVGSTMNTPLKQLKLGASYDYAGVSAQPGYGPALNHSAYQNATALYATWQVTEKLSLNGRGEYFTESKVNSFGGLPSKVVAFTATAQYDLWKNVISRLEARWDHQADGTGRAYGTASSTGFFNNPDGASRRNAYELIANIIYKF